MYSKDIYWEPYDDLAGEELRNQYIQKEMQNYRQEALKKFESIVPHPHFTLDVALSTIYAYRESINYAERIIDKLNLYEIEMLSLEDDFYSFKQIYLKEEMQKCEEWTI